MPNHVTHRLKIIAPDRMQLDEFLAASVRTRQYARTASISISTGWSPCRKACAARKARHS